MAQVDLTEGLDPKVPLADGRVWGLLCKPGLENTGIKSYAIPINPSSYESWTASSLASKLGFPLQVHELQSPSQDPTAMNIAIQGLFLNDDLSAPDFGTRKVKVWKGDVLIARTDGKDMSGVQLAVLMDYIVDTVAKSGSRLTFAGNEISRVREIARVTRAVDPGVFHAHFDEIRRKEVAAGNPDYIAIKSPVSVTYGDEAVPRVCGYCKEKGSDGKPLVKCSGCLVRWYCGRECQKREWKTTHKKACLKES